MKIFESNQYNKVMYVALIIVSLLILFNFVNILENTDKKIEQKLITGFAIDDLNNKTNSTNQTLEEKPEIYSANSHFIFYLIIIGLMVTITLIVITLKSVIMRNIKLEEEARRM